MHCPHHILAHNQFTYIILHTRGDKRWEHVKWVEKLNPLRWEVHFFKRKRGYWITLNDDACLRRKLANISWKYLGGEARFHKRMDKLTRSRSA